MLMVVNKELYVNPYNIINFINFDISGMINSIANLRSSKEYLYFFYVKEDVVFNWYSICNSFIDDQNPIDFPIIKRNTRHAIESFFDLYNLLKDPDYYYVLNYNHNNPNLPEKYKKFLYNGRFTIQSKYKIAIEKEQVDNLENFQDYFEMAKKCNSAVHPNPNVLTMTLLELQHILIINFKLLNNAYEVLLRKFNWHPFFYCSNGQPVNYQYYLNLYHQFLNCIRDKEKLLVPVSNFPYYYV